MKKLTVFLAIGASLLSFSVAQANWKGQNVVTVYNVHNIPGSTWNIKQCQAVFQHAFYSKYPKANAALKVDHYQTFLKTPLSRKKVLIAGASHATISLGDKKEAGMIYSHTLETPKPVQSGSWVYIANTHKVADCMGSYTVTQW